MFINNLLLRIFIGFVLKMSIYNWRKIYKITIKGSIILIRFLQFVVYLVFIICIKKCLNTFDSERKMVKV